MTETAAGFLTQEAHDRLKAELDQLTGEGRIEIAQQDRGGPRGGRPQGERRLPRRPRGAGQDRGPHPPAHRAAPGRDIGERPADDGVVEPGMIVDGRDRRRRGDLPARLPRDRRRLRPPGLLREVRHGRRHQRQERRRQDQLHRPQRQDHRSRSSPRSPTPAEHRPRLTNGPAPQHGDRPAPLHPPKSHPFQPSKGHVWPPRHRRKATCGRLVTVAHREPRAAASQRYVPVRASAPGPCELRRCQELRLGSHDVQDVWVDAQVTGDSRSWPPGADGRRRGAPGSRPPPSRRARLRSTAETVMDACPATASVELDAHGTRPPPCCSSQTRSPNPNHNAG